MVEVLLLHVSDTHLGSSKPLTYARARELDFYEVFDEVIDIALRERVDAVIHCGDFFDTPDPRPRTYYYAVRSLKKLSAAGIPLLVIAGQHDQPKRAEVSPLRVLEEIGVVRVLALSEPSARVVNLRSGELGITAVPYAPPEVVGNWVGGLRGVETKKRVLVAHLLLRELGVPKPHVSLAELDVVGYNYVALGDYHMKYATSRGSTPVVYPGSTEALTVSEASSERFVALVDLSTDEVVVNWVKLSRFRRIAVIDGVKSLGDLNRELGAIGLEKSGKPPVLYVKLGRLGDQYSLDSERIRSRLNELVHREVILTYKIVTPGVVEGEEQGPDIEPEEPPPTLEYVVYEVARDPEVAELLVEIVRSGEDYEAIKRLISEVANSGKLLEKIEGLVRKR